MSPCGDGMPFHGLSKDAVSGALKCRLVVVVVVAAAAAAVVDFENAKFMRSMV